MTQLPPVTARCPHCRYDLSAAHTDNTARTRCPECGRDVVPLSAAQRRHAVWRLNRHHAILTTLPWVAIPAIVFTLYILNTIPCNDIGLAYLIAVIPASLAWLLLSAALARRSLIKSGFGPMTAHNITLTIAYAIPPAFLNAPLVLLIMLMNSGA